MAYIQSYFRVNDNPQAPMFTQVWNGFMLERTTMNYKMLDAELRKMGQDELAAQEKIILENIREYVKIQSEAEGKTEEVKATLVAKMLEQDTQRYKIRSEFIINRENARTNRISALVDAGQKKQMMGPKIERALINRDTFAKHIESYTLDETFNKIIKDHRIHGNASNNNQAAFMSHFNNEIINPLLKSGALPELDKILMDEEKRMHTALIAARLEDVLSQKLKDGSIKTHSPELQRFENVMMMLSDIKQFPEYKSAKGNTSAGFSRLRRDRIKDESRRMDSIENVDIDKYIAKADSEFPTATRYNLLKKAQLQLRSSIKGAERKRRLGYERAKQAALERGVLDYDFPAYMLDHAEGDPYLLGSKTKTELDPMTSDKTVVFEGESRNLAWFDGELKRTKNMMRIPGGSTSKSKAIQSIAHDIDPIWFYKLTGYNPKKTDVRKSRKLMDIQAALDSARDDLETVRLQRVAKVRIEAMKGGPDIFKQFKSNYLMDNPFKRKTGIWKTAGKISTEFKKMVVTPTAGEEDSVEYKGLKRGVDYALPGSNQYTIGLTREDLPYLRERDTGNITIMDKSDGNYEMFARTLRQRMMRETAELARKQRTGQ